MPRMAYLNIGLTMISQQQQQQEILNLVENLNVGQAPSSAETQVINQALSDNPSALTQLALTCLALNKARERDQKRLRKLEFELANSFTQVVQLEMMEKQMMIKGSAC